MTVYKSVCFVDRAALVKLADAHFCFLFLQSTIYKCILHAYSVVPVNKFQEMHVGFHWRIIFCINRSKNGFELKCSMCLSC